MSISWSIITIFDVLYISYWTPKKPSHYWNQCWLCFYDTNCIFYTLNLRHQLLHMKDKWMDAHFSNINMPSWNLSNTNTVGQNLSNTNTNTNTAGQNLSNTNTNTNTAGQNLSNTNTNTASWNLSNTNTNTNTACWNLSNTNTNTNTLYLYLYLQIQIQIRIWTQPWSIHMIGFILLILFEIFLEHVFERF